MKLQRGQRWGQESCQRLVLYKLFFSFCNGYYFDHSRLSCDLAIAESNSHQTNRAPARRGGIKGTGNTTFFSVCQSHTFCLSLLLLLVPSAHLTLLCVCSFVLRLRLSFLPLSNTLQFYTGRAFLVSFIFYVRVIGSAQRLVPSPGTDGSAW